jgi:dihydroorotate dehydrogenase (fumarate)
MSIYFCDKEFKTPLLNAAGNWVSDKYQVQNLNDEPFIGGIVLKTCTVQPRLGNAYPNFVDKTAYCINNMGLPNMGFEYYSRMHLVYRDKPLILSIDGSNPDDTEFMLENYSRILGTEKGTVEINISCPNIRTRTSKPIALSRKILFGYLHQLFKTKRYSNLAIGLKLPPLLYDHQITGIANILNLGLFPIRFITCSNTIPNALNLEPLVHGGMSGKCCKPIALANVRRFRELLDSRIEIIGCGGIEDVGDVRDYLECGAKLVQIGTGYIRDADIFRQIGSKL